MHLRSSRRGGRAILLLAATLFAQSAVSIAQPSGAELIQAVDAESSGPDAFLLVEDVSAFAPSGEAIIEPGTTNEEVFTYSSVDTEGESLRGLHRPTPSAHPAGVFVQAAGVFVQAPQTQASAPRESTSTPDTTDEPEEQSYSPPSEDTAANAPRSDVDGASQPSSAEEDVGEPVLDPACESATGGTCSGVVGQIGCPLTTEVPVCSALGLLDQITLSGDPCYETAGQTCGAYVADVLDNIETTDACDPNNTGQTCDEYVAGTVQELRDTIPPPPTLCGLEDLCLDYLRNYLEPPQFCDIDFPTPPHVGDLGWPVNKSGVIIGDAAAYCPAIPGPITLGVCMEYGPDPRAAVSHNCVPWPGNNRVDGFSFSACAPGMWFTYAAVIFTLGGTRFVEDAHSGGVLIEPAECAQADVPGNLPPPE